MKSKYFPSNGSGKKMKEALEKLAKQGGIKLISNPVEWQKQIRKDRKLETR